MKELTVILFLILVGGFIYQVHHDIQECEKTIWAGNCFGGDSK